jgi:hypothetical protein
MAPVVTTLISYHPAILVPMQPLKTFAEIGMEFERIAALISAVGHPAFPSLGRTSVFQESFVEIDARGYHLVFSERGVERGRTVTPDLDELMYQVFDAVTFQLASTYELTHRIESQDPRRIMFRHQQELLAKISAPWAARKALSHETLLQRAPFDDMAMARAILSTKIGWPRACKEFPLPESSALPH